MRVCLCVYVCVIVYILARTLIIHKSNASTRKNLSS